MFLLSTVNLHPYTEDAPPPAVTEATNAFGDSVNVTKTGGDDVVSTNAVIPFNAVAPVAGNFV